MNLEFYRIIGNVLTKGIDKSYKSGLASIVKLNKKEILRLKDNDEPELFKINYTGTDYMMLQNFKVEAFTVAGVQTYELEEKLKQLALDIQEGKHPLAKGEKDIKELWVAEAQNLIGDYVPVPDMPPPNQLKTNLRTAMQSSYHAAQYNRLQDKSVKDLYPAYQYKTLADARVREEHRRLHDRIWKSDDEVWHRIWPPNGWNCRCYVKPLNQDEVNNFAVEPLTTSDEVRQEIVEEGKISKDFDRNPGVVGSIWGKWKDAKLKEKNWDEIFQSTLQYSRSINKTIGKEPLQDYLELNADEFREVEYSKENWDNEFPNDICRTVFGDNAHFKIVKVKGFGKVSQFRKLEINGWTQYMGLIKPTLQNPLFVIKDEHGGLIFLKPFKKGNGRIDFASIAYKEGDIIEIVSNHEKYKFDELLRKFDTGEVLPLKASSTTGKTGFSRWNTSPNLPGLSKLNSKINFFDNIKNIKITADTLNENEVKNIMLNANEIWGETYNHNGVVNSELNFMRYRIDGFQLVKVNNNDAYESKFIGYDKIDEYRKGVILYA